MKFCFSDMIFMCFYNKRLVNGYSSREGAMCILVHWNKIGSSDSAKVQDQVWKRSTIVFFNSSMVQEIYGDRVSVLDAVISGRARTSAENIEGVMQACSRSPMKSIHTAARELELPLTTVHKVLHTRLRLYAYKVQTLHRLQPNDKTKQKEYADNMLQRISDDEELLTASSTDPVSINFLCHRRIEERDGGSFPYLALYLRWVWTSNFVSMNHNTHWASSWGVTTNQKFI